MSDNKLYRPRIAPTGGPQSLDDLVSKNALQALRKDPHTKAVIRAAPAADHEQALVASLVKRLTDVETANSELRRQCAQLAAENEKLLAQSAAYPGAMPPQQLPAAASSTASPRAAVRHLQEEAARLRQQCKAAWAQVADMKAFLNDHGLIWVGSGSSTDTDGAHTADPAAKAAKQSLPLPEMQTPSPAKQQQPNPQQGVAGLPCRIQDLVNAVAELNSVAGEGIGHIAPSAPGQLGARLHTAEALPLVLFADGLQLGSHAPRPYADATAAAVLHDILDGYFPSVLRREHPDGVPLEVVERTGETMAAAAAALPGNMRTFEQLGRASPSSKDALLAQLPKTVIRSGRVIDVRKGVAEFLNSNEVQPTQSDANRHMLVRASSAVGAHREAADAVAVSSATPNSSNSPGAAAGAAAQAAPMTILQVKSEDGKDTYVLKLKYKDTLATVRRCIDAHRATAASTGTAAGAAAKQYELRSRVPPKAYVDELQTLEEAGLIPNATLFMKLV